MNKPDYIEIQWRIRCDGWWRKALIGVVAFVTIYGGVARFVESFF